MSIRKRALLLVPVLLVLASATFAIAGTVVDYTFDDDGNTKDAITSSDTSVYISAKPAYIWPGGTSKLSWTSANADSCYIEGIGSVDCNSSRKVTLDTTTTYTITATRGASTATSSVTVTVTESAQPSAWIWADPAIIHEGESSTLHWSFANATSCTIEPSVVPCDQNGSSSVSPIQTTTYTITAYGAGETIAKASATITVTSSSAPPPTVETFSANPPVIDYGKSTTLSWRSTNADWCDIEPDIGIVDPNWSISVSPEVTTTYTITAYGIGGEATQPVTVTVTTAPTPTVSISAKPMVLKAGTGASSILSWRSTNAEWCDIEPDVGIVGPNWSIDVSPSATRTYTITAFGGGGTIATKRVTVIVASALTVQMSADPESIAYGSSSTLAWDSLYATSCKIDHGVGNVPVTGSIAITPAVTTTYTITATGAGRTARARTTINVQSVPPQTLYLRPNAAGDETSTYLDQFPTDGAHYDKVDEVDQDGYDTFVFFQKFYTGAYPRDLYNLENTSLSGTINWVKVWITATNYNLVETSDNHAKTVIKTGGTVYEGSEITLTSTFTKYYTQYATNPKTGVAWTWDDINNLQAGVSLFVGDGQPAYCTQVYVEVNYTPAPVPTPLTILHRDGALWSSDTGWNMNQPPYYSGSDYARALELRTDNSYVILHKEGAIYDSASGWITTTPPYYPGTVWAVDLKLDGSGNYVLLHKDGALWSSATGWNMNQPPYYAGSDYARALEVRTDNSYVILHTDGAIYDSDFGWITTLPPYYPGGAWAIDLKLDEILNYVLLHRDGALWASNDGWTMTTPPYYAGSDYARALELAGSRYIILHKEGAVYDSASGWITTTPPYYPGTAWAVDMKLK